MNILPKQTRILLLFLIVLISINNSKGQSGVIYGELKDIKNNQPILYAAVSIYNQIDSSVYLSTITDGHGVFTIDQVNNGVYYLKTSCLGYDESVIDHIKIDSNQQDYNCNIIKLKEKSFLIKEIQVTANRAKGKTNNEKTIYTVKNEMINSAYNGTELLKYVPGVQLDLQKNIYLEGKSNVIILVNGKERDKDFINQLSSEKIDRIEVSTSSSPKYDSDVAGIINIILKKDENSGLVSNLNFETPLSNSAIFINPSLSFGYGRKKLDMFLSYNGGFHYFDIESNRQYNTFSDIEGIKVSNNSALKQKNWNHRINLSIDYFINEKNSITFYSYYNPYKSEFDGISTSEILRPENNSGNINYSNNDKDHNTANLYSLFYKHLFDNTSSELTADLSFYTFNGKSSYTVWDINQTGSYSYLPTDSSEYCTKFYPKRFSNYLKLDYTTKISDNVKIDIGSKLMYSNYTNRNSGDFKFSRKNLAAYFMLTHKLKKLTTTLGLRGEYLNSSLKNEFNKDYYSMLPYFVTSYKIKNNHTLKLSYKKSTFKPGLYDLNPEIIANDLFSAQIGNPGLGIEYGNNIALEYSTQIKSNYLSLQGYYEYKKDMIHYTGEYTPENQILFTPENIDKEINYGLKLSGSLSFFKVIQLVPYFKIYQYDIEDETNIFPQSNSSGVSLEASLSGTVMLKHNFSLSFMYQYASPKYFIQNSSFSDDVYFFSIDKKINNIKVGIAAAIPFENSFTYYGSKYHTENFSFNREENITFSIFPVWFKLSYSLNSGKKVINKQRRNDMNEVKPNNIF